MWRGKPVRALLKQDAYLLSPINYHKQSTGRALLLLHGFSSSPAVYREILPALTIYDAVLCPILPGHAKSIDAFAKTTSNEWVDTATQSFQKLHQNYAEVDVMGLSLGGVLASKISEHCLIRHLYLLAPALVLHHSTNLLLTLARIMQYFGLKRIPNQAGNFHTSKHQELTYRQLPIHAIIEILTLIRNTALVVPKCPTDLFLGRFDAVVNSSAVASLLSDNSNITTHWLNNSAHILPLDGDVEKIINCVLKNYGPAL